MNGFGFSLAEGAWLREEHDGFLLLSKAPVRVLRLNESMYRLLEHVRSGGGIADFAEENGLDERKLLRVLLALAAGGYLKLERIGDMEEYPRVSVIIPVRDQAGDLADCLEGLAGLDYPGDRLQIIVVDDGSRKEVSRILTADGVEFARLGRSLGQAAARNLGTEKATGEILAFIDADCVPGEGWLRETVPFFQAEGVGAVGGYVDGYYHKRLLDRYERVASSLNMGKRILLEGDTDSSFYVPTANLLVRRDVFMSTGGFRAGMSVGEDVDFCWRMRKTGQALLYVPYGTVAHKHRNRCLKMLERRARYGTSEAVLYPAHRDKKKAFVISPLSGLAFLALAVSLLLLNPYPLPAIPLLFGADLWRKWPVLKRFGEGLTPGGLASAIARSYLSFAYFAFFHLVRYYLALIIGLGFLWYPLWIFGGLAVAVTSAVDYYVRRPALFYPVFLCFYVLEHLAYQVGVFLGCLGRLNFRAYRLSFRLS